MINRINNNEINNTVNPISQQQPKQPRTRVNNADTQIDVKYDQLIEKANQPQQPDQLKIAKARLLLATNQLDNPENIRKAAQNMINNGI
ncbi:MAG: hypothetical protein KAS23_08285 [Anaerohalosphaera sp.]|nr:hypothetical protein [Anaerohalosphaera sp.]